MREAGTKSLGNFVLEHGKGIANTVSVKTAAASYSRSQPRLCVSLDLSPPPLPLSVAPSLSLGIEIVAEVAATAAEERARLMSAEVFSRDASIWAPFSVPCPSLPYADPDRRALLLFLLLFFLLPRLNLFSLFSALSLRTLTAGIMQRGVSFHSTFHFSFVAPRRLREGGKGKRKRRLEG